jgi:hypothetical protein
MAYLEIMYLYLPGDAEENNEKFCPDVVSNLIHPY